MLTKTSPTNIEKTLDINDFIVSKTDLRGIITYVNKIFIDIAGYSETELIGTPHNIIRHPDMPKAAFADLWATVKEEKEWRGLVKNMCRDGGYYWVDAYVIQNRDTSGKVIGYTSMRRKPTDLEIKNIIPVYKEMIAKER